jgi:hypothetical protein
MFLGKPEEASQVLLESFSAERSGTDYQISAVSLLGAVEPLEWKLEKSGLRIRMPEEGLNPLSTALKIEIQD